MVGTIVQPSIGRRRGGRRTALELASEREAERLARTLGSQVAAAPGALGWTQARLAAKVGLSQSRISSIEDGLGGGAPLGVWIALGIALGLPIAVAFSRPLVGASADAGHLPGQELALALARRNGRPGSVELPTRPFNPTRMVDVAVRDDLRRVLILQEISNRIDDIGQTIRDHRLKVAEADAVAAVIGGDDGPYRVRFCWIVRATAANRALLARYPEVIEHTFPGSSRAWVLALVDGGPIPREPRVVWMDVPATRLFEYRRSPKPEAIDHVDEPRPSGPRTACVFAAISTRGVATRPNALIGAGRGGIRLDPGWQDRAISVRSISRHGRRPTPLVGRARCTVGDLVASDRLGARFGEGPGLGVGDTWTIAPPDRPAAGRP